MNQHKFIRFLASGFGAGYSPVAPGTAGTIVAIPLYLGMRWMAPLSYMGLTLILIVAAVILSDIAVEEFEEEDPQKIVVDEIVGFLVAMVWLPQSWTLVGLGFVIFRFFDMVKPFPISFVDRKIKGGIGVVADDLLAGVGTNILLQIIVNFYPNI